MQEEHKPFICVKQGWSMKIVPRGAAGWRSFGMWMMGFGIVLAIFTVTTPRLEDRDFQAGAVVAFLSATAIWAVAMIRWMLRRSEIVDLNELMEIKRQNDHRGPTAVAANTDRARQRCAVCASSPGLMP